MIVAQDEGAPINEALRGWVRRAPRRNEHEAVNCVRFVTALQVTEKVKPPPDAAKAGASGGARLFVERAF
jgi:hypothetical protein